MAKRPPPDRFVEFQSFALFRQHDKVDQFMSILFEHDRGQFRRSADLVDEVLTDDRIAGVAETRQSAVKAAPFTVEPAGDRRIEKKLAEELGGKDKQAGLWPSIVTQDTLGELLQWGWFLGFGLAQIVWLREPRRWQPYLELWHPRWVRWDQTRRAYIVQTENRGEVVLPRLDENPRGDGRWFQWLPFGVQGWTRGLLRSLALKYLSRQWNERDWDRYNETRSMGILKGSVPSNSLAEHKDQYFQQLSNLGSEPVVITPQTVDPDGKAGAGFDVQAVEFTARSWETLKERKGGLDVDVAVRVLGQNLTTEGGTDGGSRALGEVQNLVRIDKAIADSLIGPAIRAQVLTWYAEFNYGDPELAPWPTYNVEPAEDEVAEATAIKTLGEGITALKAAEPRLDVSAIVEEHGYPMFSEEELAARAAAGGPGGGATQLTPTAIGAIITVNEARSMIGIGPLLTDSGGADPDGELTVAEFQAKYASTVAVAANAEAGKEEGAEVTADDAGAEEPAADEPEGDADDKGDQEGEAPPAEND